MTIGTCITLRACTGWIKDLAGIHQTFWIQRHLHLVHDHDRVEAQLLDQRLFLSQADSMFSLSGGQR